MTAIGKALPSLFFRAVLEFIDKSTAKCYNGIIFLWSLLMKKVLLMVLKIFIVIVLVVGLALLGFKAYDGIKHAAFYKNADPAFKTPGTNDGFVQQGFDYIEEEKAFLVTGYTSNGKPSRVYVIKEDGSTTCTELKKADGSDYTGHTGGIVRNGEFVYITGGNGVDVFSYGDILAGKAAVQKLGEVKTYTDPAHCYIENGYLLTGSFFIEEDYETPAHERMTTPCGDENTSIITVFKLDGAQPFGVDPTPKAVISTRRCVQGMCVTDDGKVILSTSYGLSTSQLFVYDASELPIEENYTFEGTTEDGEAFSFTGLKLLYLESADCVEVIKAPPMAEELVYADGKIYIMNESACNKYIFGKITTGRNIYAYEYRK